MDFGCDRSGPVQSKGRAFQGFSIRRQYLPLLRVIRRAEREECVGDFCQGRTGRVIHNSGAEGVSRRKDAPGFALESKPARTLAAGIGRSICKEAATARALFVGCRSDPSSASGRVSGIESDRLDAVEVALAERPRPDTQSLWLFGSSLGCAWGLSRERYVPRRMERSS